ncbi:hypothetical protein GC177_10340 [bacterium]|nr:hypothetical protein [bacterium]
MIPQPTELSIGAATKALSRLLANASLLKYFYGYQLEYIQGERGALPRLYISHTQPAAASLLSVFFSDNIGLGNRQSVVERSEPTRYGIELPFSLVEENTKALKFIATQADAYSQVLRMLRECPDVIHAELSNNRLVIHARTNAAEELLNLDAMSVLDGPHNEQVSNLFRTLAISPEPLMWQLPNLYEIISHLVQVRHQMPSRAGLPSLASL